MFLFVSTCYSQTSEEKLYRNFLQPDTTLNNRFIERDLIKITKKNKGDDIILDNPTIEQRLDRIEDSLNINWNVIVTNDSLPQPTYEGIVMQSLTSDQYIFNPSIYVNGYSNLYCIKNNAVYLATSPNGLNSWTYTLTNAGAGSIVNVDGKYYDSFHKWYGGQAYSYYSVSLDKVYFQNVATSRTPTGEDRNVLFNGTEFYSYGRLQPKPRTIMFQRSSDFRLWTNPNEILKPDAVDGSNVEFYHLSVIKTERGYFGLLNLYYTGLSGQDVEQLPPYTAKEHTTEIQLVYSANGIDNWQRLNSRKEFIPKRENIKQMFGWWSLINGIAYIYTAESKRRHTTYENSNINGRYYFSSEYKISLTDLYKYIQ